MGYASRGTVYKIIRDAQASQLSGAVEEHRQLELERLDALQTAVWDQAMDGDVSAAQTVLQLITARCRLLGLTQPPPGKGIRCEQPQTVVMLPNDCRGQRCPDHS